ncbi:cytochrome c oxidase subunit 6a, mitochondrial-like [Telopea speciosissima]|uniref:cytochrome c oxidase subunit 6a, mitochondrial-like n=1 Tax=Telopea speciosissima TaxID=54955 RepID=UPI001CC4F8D3|nr:cytochrome c oxidase subunit 6a, mitochondrial-like [Telopea speciosissima]
MAMAMAMMRSGFQAALRRGTRTAPSKRGFASSAQHDDAHEAAKWEKITYAGIVSCTILAVVNLSKGHPHFDEPPAYPYLHIRNKEFPWGPDGLFEVKEHH